MNRNTANKVLEFIKTLMLLTLFVVLITMVCRTIITNGFGVALDSKFWHRDFLGNLAVAIIVALLVQSLRKTLVLSGYIILLFQLCNAAKLSVLGTPASPDDFFNIQNFFFLTDGWRRIVLFAIAGLPLALALAFFAWKRASAWLALGLLTVAGIIINMQSEPLRVALDTHIGNSVWNQPANFRARGLALHLAHETIRTASKVEKPPEKQTVDAALEQLGPALADQVELEPAFNQALSPYPIAPQRNVHVFVLESFFDPISLGEQWVPEDPLPADFRELWAATGYSTAMAPVFGGYTANAEFEMLCGFPVTYNAVFFEGWLRRAAPCLPRVLKQSGYHSVASHPNVPGFWNRTVAYKLIGIDEYMSKAQFDMSDSVDTLLLDASMYEQVFDHIEKKDNSGPVFNYMLTYHGHLPYPSSEKYPDKVEAGKESVLLHGYLNQIWYKSRHLMQRLDILRQNDPDALIVIFGDHLPFLGPNYGVYTEAWNLPGDRSDFSGEELRKLTSTPLIVIDGKRGPLTLGETPIYRMPSIVVSLLGLEPNNAFDASRNPDALRVRPVYGMHYTVADNNATACADASLNTTPCNTSETWLEKIKVITSDIFTGGQFSLE